MRSLAAAAALLSFSAAAQILSVETGSFSTTSTVLVPVPGSALLMPTFGPGEYLILFTARLKDSAVGDPAAELVIDQTMGTRWAGTSSRGPDTPTWSGYDFMPGTSTITLRANLRSVVPGTATLDFFRMYALQLQPGTNSAEVVAPASANQTGWMTVVAVPTPTAAPSLVFGYVEVTGGGSGGIAARLSNQGISYQFPLPGMGDQGYFLHFGQSKQSAFFVVPSSIVGTVDLEVRASPMVDGGVGAVNSVPITLARISVVPLSLFGNGSLSSVRNAAATAAALDLAYAEVAIDAGASCFTLTSQLVGLGPGSAGVSTRVDAAEVSRVAVGGPPGNLTVGHIGFVSGPGPFLRVTSGIFGVDGGVTVASSPVVLIIGGTALPDGGVDAGTDAGTDAGLDGGVDAGQNAGTQDAGSNAGPDGGTSTAPLKWPVGCDCSSSSGGLAALAALLIFWGRSCSRRRRGGD